MLGLTYNFYSPIIRVNIASKYDLKKIIKYDEECGILPNEDIEMIYSISSYLN